MQIHYQINPYHFLYFKALILFSITKFVIVTNKHKIVILYLVIHSKRMLTQVKNSTPGNRLNINILQ